MWRIIEMNIVLVAAADTQLDIHDLAMTLSQKEGNVPLLMPPEAGLSTGLWSDVKAYLDGALPEMRKALQELINQGASGVYALVGRDVGTLYGAYYALLEKKASVKAIFHYDQLGGTSHFAERNRPIIKRLGAMIYAHAETHVNLLEPEPLVPMLPKYPRKIPLIDGPGLSFVHSGVKESAHIGMRMDIRYINLDTATERRRSIEETLRDANFSAEWPLRRFEAIRGSDEIVRKFGGSLKRNHAGSFASHLACLEESFDDDAYLMITEDDTLFSKRTEAMVYQAMNNLRSVDWDLLYTDVAITNPHHMIDFFERRKQLEATDTIEVCDLRPMNFCGSSCYIINKASKRKVFKACSTLPITIYDLLLRNRVHDGTLNAYVIFPFATSLSPLTHQSCISDIDERGVPVAKPKGVSLGSLWTAFRQLVWIDANPEEAIKSYELIPPEAIDIRAIAFSKIIQGLVVSGPKY
jgi:GR25 family glycosyltransferase involved in LPS biosynthesis